MSSFLALLFGGLASLPGPAPSLQEPERVAFVRRSYEAALESRDEDLRQWKAQWERPDEELLNAIELLGYREPSFLLRIADLGSWLFERTGESSYAETAAAILVDYGEHRRHYPAALLERRPEAQRGIPAVSWFKHLPVYARAWRRTRDVPALYSDFERRTVEDHIAESVEAIFEFPEWGAHNRAMLRAWSLLAAAEALPDHPRSAAWQRMADILSSDSLGQWEIEDAQVYHALWLEATIHVLDLSGQPEAWSSPMLRYYFDYLVCLLAPNRTIPPFGDGWWSSQMPLYWAVLERGAQEYRSPEMKWAAGQIRQAHGLSFEEPDPGLAQLWIAASDWISADVSSRRPSYTSRRCLEDLYGKKVVLREGWEPDDAFLLYSYKDEGGDGLLQKDYLRRVLAVEEEKMTHGQSDEQSIVLWMEQGSVLLVDAGYRERSPSGEYGAYRSDLFHNRLVLRSGKRSPNQPLLEVLRASGAYDESVRTYGLDFQSLKRVEYVRSRWTSERVPAEWDRTLVRHRAGRWLLLVDSVRFLEEGYFTVANLLHGQKAVDSGEEWAVLRYEQVDGKEVPSGQDLLVVFLGTSNQETGGFDLHRNRQAEQTVYSSTSRWYDRGAKERFVTVLQPIATGEAVEPYLKGFELVKADGPGIGVAWSHRDRQAFAGVKLDLDHGLLDAEVRPRYTIESGRIRYDASPSVTTDADLVLYWKEADGEPGWLATNMTHVDLGEERVFEAAEIPFFQTWGRSDRTGRAKWRLWSSETMELQMK